MLRGNVTSLRGMGAFSLCDTVKDPVKEVDIYSRTRRAQRCCKPQPDWIPRVVPSFGAAYTPSSSSCWLLKRGAWCFAQGHSQSEQLVHASLLCPIWTQRGSVPRSWEGHSLVHVFCLLLPGSYSLSRKTVSSKDPYTQENFSFTV